MAFNGYICVPRDLRNHWIWQQDKKLKMWLDLVMLASWEDLDVAIGNTLLKIHRGQYATSVRAISRIWGCCNQTASEFLKLLEQSNLIKREITTKISIITIVDYDKYQPSSVQPSGHFSAQEEEKKNNKKKKIIIQSSQPSKEADEKFYEEFFNQQIEFENCAMHFHIPIDEVKRFAEEFKSEQLLLKKYHKDFKDLHQHFINWLRIKLNSLNSKNTNGQQPKTTQSGKTGESSEAKAKYAARRGTDAGSHSPDEYGGAF